MRSSASLTALWPLLVAGSVPAQDAPFELLRRMVPPLPDLTAAAFGDLDGDGDTDAVTTWTGSPRAVLLRNDGNGRFRREAGVLPDASGESVTAVALGDVDDDGDLDVFVGASFTLDLFLNDGTGSFGPAPGFPLVSTPRKIRLGDVNGDGCLDFLVVVNAYAVDQLFLGDGTGGFTQSSAGIYLGFTRDARLADLDGDDDLDVIGLVQSMPHLPTGVYVLHYEDSLGLVLAPAALFPAPSGVFSIDLGDVDGDGDSDVVLGGSFGERLYSNDGAGRFREAPGALPSSEGSSLANVLLDVDGDLDLDLFSARLSAAGAEPLQALSINDGAGTFADGSDGLPHEHSAPALQLATADADGDGDVDVLAGNRLYFGDGAGVFRDGQEMPPPRFAFVAALDLFDVDLDGDLDALSLHGTRNALWLNEGTGRLSERTERLPDAPHEKHVDLAFGDVDGDGGPDTLLAGPNELYLSVEPGFFRAAPAERTPLAPRSNGVALGDVDQDGDLDAILACGGRYAIGHRAPAPNALWHNTGTGYFVDDASGLPSEAEESLAVVLGDLDGDGDLDVVIGNEGANRLYRNEQEARVFTDASQRLPFVDDDTRDLRLGDLNGDGDLDLVTSDGRGNRLFENDGTGSFSLADVFAPDETPSASRTNVDVVDTDRDGDLDLLASRVRSLAAVIDHHENDGSGGLARGVSLPARSLRFAAGDLDGDGDVDLFTGDEVLTNLTRALAWGSLPRIGRPLELELYGPPWGRWSLVGSAAAPAIVRNRPGFLRLVASRTFFIRRGRLDDDGRTTVTLDVPDEASLEGVTIFWQAWIAGRLANLEKTTLSAF